jgi:DNA end-binding protein Ku
MPTFLTTSHLRTQTGHYDPADVEDRYETRLRALIDAKIKGKGLEPEAEEEPEQSNVVDLMAALRKSLGQGAEGTSKPKNSSRDSSTKKTKHAASSNSTGAKTAAAAARKKSPAAKPAARRRA